MLYSPTVHPVNLIEPSAAAVSPKFSHHVKRKVSVACKQH